MTAVGTLKSKTLTALSPVSLAGDVLFSQRLDLPLGDADRELLLASFASSLAHLKTYLNRPTAHVFVPLGSPESGHHVAFQGPCHYEDLKPFFRCAPNALTVEDGRPYGYLRFRLIHVDGTSFTRIADIEVSLAHDAPSVGFELVWAPSELENLRVIRFVQRKGEEAVHQVSRLIAEWGAKFHLLKAYPELQRPLALR